MSLRLCIDCATVWLMEGDQPLTCPRCGQSLKLSEQLGDNAATFAEIAVIAVHGEAPRARKLWEVG